MAATFDFSAVNKLAADLGNLPATASKNIAKAVEVTARNIKDDARQSAEQIDNASLSGYPSAIDYDMKLGVSGQIGAEIGPNLGSNQGSFGFVEDAAGGVDSPPQGNLRKAASKNTDDFERGILKATEGLL